MGVTPSHHRSNPCPSEENSRPDTFREAAGKKQEDEAFVLQLEPLCHGRQRHTRRPRSGNAILAFPICKRPVDNLFPAWMCVGVMHRDAGPSPPPGADYSLIHSHSRGCLFWNGNFASVAPIPSFPPSSLRKRDSVPLAFPSGAFVLQFVLWKSFSA